DRDLQPRIAQPPILHLCHVLSLPHTIAHVRQDFRPRHTSVIFVCSNRNEPCIYERSSQQPSCYSFRILPALTPRPGSPCLPASMLRSSPVALCLPPPSA